MKPSDNYPKGDLKPTDKNPMASPQHITVIAGDGIGQEVVDATLQILDAASAPLTWVHCQAGEACFRNGIATGVPEDTLATIKQTKVVLKGPLSTPVGFGERSANVYLRKYFGLFANVRPVKQYPNVPSLFKDTPIDLVVIRENIEDLYAGIEYSHQPGIAHSIKLISEYGCNYINTFAYEYAKLTQRKSIHCATKANILKKTEGMMKRSFEQLSTQYPGINAKHMIIDNCAHQLVVNPSQFDMIVTTNMNGDIISDLTSGLVGGLGIAPSANIGQDVAMFEAVHGAAPDIAGQQLANPTAMILSAIMMCRYIGMDDVADTIEHALAKTFYDSKMTGDLNPTSALSTNAFTTAVIERLGDTCPGFTPSSFKPIHMPPISTPSIQPGTCHGIDVVIISDHSPTDIAHELNRIATANGCEPVELFNRGKAVHSPEKDQMISQWFCRFTSKHPPFDNHHILKLVNELSQHYHWAQIEKLCTFNE